MTNQNDLAKRIIQAALDNSSNIPSLTIEGKRYPLPELESMNSEQRGQWGRWGAEYIEQFIIAAHSKADYPVIFDPDDESVEVQPFIPGKMIIHVIYYSVNPNESDSAA